MAITPFDTVRYFEFDFFFKRLGNLRTQHFLDVSSPRLWPLLVLAGSLSARGLAVNPDEKDLGLTRELLTHIGLVQKCDLACKTLSEIELAHGGFDLVSCMSVLEHIPLPEDIECLRHAWHMLRPGGTFLLSVPVAAEAFEEYVDFDEYGLLAKDERGFVFGQRFYDQELLEERVFSVMGRPKAMEVFGERVAGHSLNNRTERLTSARYPFWAEALIVGQGFRRFSSTSEMPGWGVAAMQFEKPVG